MQPNGGIRMRYIILAPVALLCAVAFLAVAVFDPFQAWARIAQLSGDQQLVFGLAGLCVVWLIACVVWVSDRLVRQDAVLNRLRESLSGVRRATADTAEMQREIDAALGVLSETDPEASISS